MENIISIIARDISSHVEVVNIDSDNVCFNASFDFTPVFRNEDYVGIIKKEQYLKINSIEKSITKYTENIVGYKTAIDIILKKLSIYKFVMVVDEKGCYSIITEADLYKQPFRVYLFNHISNYEIAITEKFRKHFLQNEFVLEKFLSEKNSWKVKQRFEEKKSKNVEVDYFEEMDLSDKSKIFKKIGFLNKIDISGKKYDTLFEKVNNLRNEIAHSKNVSVLKDLDQLLEIIIFMKKCMKA